MMDRGVKKGGGEHGRGKDRKEKNKNKTLGKQTRSIESKTHFTEIVSPCLLL